MVKKDTDDNIKTKRIITMTLIALGFIGILLCCFLIIRQIARGYKSELALANTPGPGPSATPTERPPKVYEGWLTDYAREADREIDFETLKQTNPDVCAWISVPGTDVDFPVLYAEKNDWRYLDYDINMQPSLAGAIFTDGWNSADFSDPVSMVYGHNMKDGTMFASLHRFRDARFFEKYSSIFIYIDDYMLEYEVFGAYETSDEHILATYDFSNPDVFAAYLKGIPEIRDLNANFRDTPLSKEDRLITLVSSVIDKDTARYFVQGVLLKNG